VLEGSAPIIQIATGAEEYESEIQYCKIARCAHDPVVGVIAVLAS
jgi:hypothetical protein